MLSRQNSNIRHSWHRFDFYSTVYEQYFFYKLLKLRVNFFDIKKWNINLVWAKQVSCQRLFCWTINAKNIKLITNVEKKHKCGLNFYIECMQNSFVWCFINIRNIWRTKIENNYIFESGLHFNYSFLNPLIKKFFTYFFFKYIVL